MRPVEAVPKLLDHPDRLASVMHGGRIQPDENPPARSRLSSGLFRFPQVRKHGLVIPKALLRILV